MISNVASIIGNRWKFDLENYSFNTWMKYSGNFEWMEGSIKRILFLHGM